MFAHSRKLLVFALLGAMINLAPAVQVHADSVAVAITPDPGNTFNNGLGPYVLGYEFQANANITVTQLGYFVDSTLTESHDVGLYDATTMSLLASTTVVNGDMMVANFAYNAISGVTLTAGNDYVIVATSGQNDSYTFNPTSFSTDSAITFVQSAFSSASSLQFPDFPGDGNTGYFGPNFLFTTAAVPEPSSLVLGSLAALAGLLVTVRRRLR
jgi:Domain of unknown function (DUF4082)